MLNTNGAGFSLLELMIVIVLISVIASLSVGEYQFFIYKSRRSDAQTSLLDYHARLQRCYMRVYSYPDCVTELQLHQPQNSFNNFYLLQAITVSDTHYLLQATAQQEQKFDENCYQFTIDTLQATHAYKKNGQENHACWQK